MYEPIRFPLFAASAYTWFVVVVVVSFGSDMFLSRGSLHVSFAMHVPPVTHRPVYLSDLSTTSYISFKPPINSTKFITECNSFTVCLHLDFSKNAELGQSNSYMSVTRWLLCALHLSQKQRFCLQ